MSEPPYRYERTHSTAEVRERFGGLEPGVETGEVVSVAGRLMLRRAQGKLVFGALQDATGRIQLFARSGVTPDLDGFGGLALGDWVGVTGQVLATRRGELSVEVSEWTVLASARQPFPDKWHGLSDPDTRYRQREVDLWVTERSRRTFVLRSRLISATRRWLEDRGFIEVETPVLHPLPGGALARPFATHHHALDSELFLRIAPELYLKRLVVGGFERVFEIGRVFRNEGISTRHNPEFTMLELYQAYADWTDMMALVEDLVEHLAVALTGSATVEVGGRPLDLSGPWRRAPLTDLVSERTGVELDMATPLARLAEVAVAWDVAVEDGWGTGKVLLELYEKTVEAELWDPVHVTGYPQEVSPLARSHRELDGLTERFESIVAGRELANAFSELVDPDDQRARFEAQARARAGGDDEAMAVDEEYLRALEHGLPPTGGLGIGIDRLVMLLADVSTIRDVVLFPTLRPRAPQPVTQLESEAGTAAGAPPEPGGSQQ